LRKLQRDAKRGDHVVVFFAGHGVQLPVGADMPWAHAEPDGLMELFLPQDAGRRYAGGPKYFPGIENAIADVELRAWADAMTAKGVRVLMVFDTCHAGTLVRGAEENTGAGEEAWVARRVDVSALDVLRADSTPRGHLMPKPWSQSLAGSGTKLAGQKAADAVFLYAALAHEPTFERRFWNALSARHEVRGMFSHHLAQAIQTAPNATPRTWLQMVGHNYKQNYAVRPTPLGAGTGLDMSWGAPGAAPERWFDATRQGDSLWISAGVAQGVRPGQVWRWAGAPQGSASPKARRDSEGSSQSSSQSEKHAHADHFEIEAVDLFRSQAQRVGAATQPVGDKADRSAPADGFAHRMNRVGNLPEKTENTGPLKPPTGPAAQAPQVCDAMRWLDFAKQAQQRTGQQAANLRVQPSVDGKPMADLATHPIRLRPGTQLQLALTNVAAMPMKLQIARVSGCGDVEMLFPNAGEAEVMEPFARRDLQFVATKSKRQQAFLLIWARSFSSKPSPHDFAQVIEIFQPPELIQPPTKVTKKNAKP
jgi:hypothetical protein